MNLMHSQRYARALCLLPLLLAPLVASAAPVYTVNTLGTTGAYSYAYGINDVGQVVGVNVVRDAGGNSSFHGFVSTNGVMTDIGTLGGTRSFAKGINNLGQVVGYSTLAGDAEARAFVYSNGTMLPIGSLGGTNDQAASINSAGHVAGYGHTSSNAIHAFLYADGNMRDLGPLGSYWGGYSVAHGINDAGQVVGWAFTNNSSSHAFLYSDGTMTDLGTLGPNTAYSSTATAINNAGEVVGYSATPNGSHAFLYADGVMSDLGTLGPRAGWIGGSDSGATGINDLGDVIGYTDTPTEFYRPFLYTNGTMWEVNKLIDAASGWRISDVTGINDHRQIAATGCNDTGCHAVRLDLVQSVPVPEPQTFSLLLGGMLLLGLATHRNPHKPK